MPELSIIIISYNTKDITQHCLDTVLQSLKDDPKMQVEIIVLDNASTDGSKEMLLNYEKKLNNHHSIHLCFYPSTINLGFGPGNNEAVKHARGRYLLFLNSDTEALDNAIPQLLTLYKQHNFDFAGAKLLNKDLTPQLSASRFYSLPVAFAALFLFADKWHFTRFSPRHIKKVDWLSGACFITTKDRYEKLHGFDPKIFMYWEEVDLFYRAHIAGMTTSFFPQPCFIHLEGASSASRTQPILKVFQGYIYFYKKHCSPLQVSILKGMLQLKALLSLAIGKATGNTYLIETYSKAYEIAQDH